ncbi:MAG: hypothetical protein LQ343_001000 [Gyalolechia ehrenbergii]|nr:MAG: hypothetical protein LQ343_001000 [Gyalolechia ehrenbergii]
MTRSSLGLIFSNYEYSYSVLHNNIIVQTLIEAAQKINQQLASNPNLANQALDDEWVYVQEEHEYQLGFVPDTPKMTYGNIPIIIPVISTWATQFAGTECDFEIWAWPGMSAQRKLGKGHLRLAFNFPKMPGQTFPYHMTPDKPLGLIFNHYDYLSTFDNYDILQTLVGAAHEIDQEIAPNPTLANQTLDHGWSYEHDPIGQTEDYYYISLHPYGAAMTYGDVPTVIAVLATWATQYRTVETDFEIWSQPGTGEQRRLGHGNLLLVI